MADSGARATFFALGVVARDYPALIRRIASEGHELACHGWDHDLVDALPGGELEEAIKRAKSTIEDICGEEVLGFRCPNFSVNASNWGRYLDALEAEGFRYDSSAYSGRLFYGGLRGGPREIGRIEGRNLMEFPPSAGRIAGYAFPLGGFYLRLLPAGLFAGAVEREGAKGCAIVYLHPKDIDAENPKLPINPLFRLVHSIGVKKGEAKFSELIKRFEFTSIRESGLLAAFTKEVL